MRGLLVEMTSASYQHHRRQQSSTHSCSLIDLPQAEPHLESLAVIPVSDAASIVPALNGYIAALQQTTARTRKHNPAFLVPHATTSAPNQTLSENTANILSDLFPSVRALEEATRTRTGQTDLRNWVDAFTADDIIDFWEDEWIV